MATHDYVIANGSGAAVRADLNDALAAIVTGNSNATAPTTTYAYEPWFDTSTSPATIKRRDGSNASWITIGYADGSIDLGSVATPAIRFNGDTNTGIYSPGADQVAISTGGTQRATVDDSGRLLVGATSGRTNFNNSTQSGSNVAKQIIEGADGGYSASLALVSNRVGTGNNANLIFAKSNTSTLGSNTAVVADTVLGGISFEGSDGTEFVRGAIILAEVDGTPGANDMPGRLIFGTTSDGASTSTERMRINNGGDILFGTTGVPNGTSIYGAGFEATSNNRMVLKTASSVTSSNSLVAFYNPNGNIGTISTSGSATAYNTSSDYRLKENIIPLTGASERVLQLKPSRFNFIADPDTQVDGFIAHEAQAVVPECVIGVKDEVDAEGNPVYQGIDQSKLVPLLTAALQEALAKIEALEARLTALEAN